MKATVKTKMFIDLLMTILLLMLMAYQVTGEMLHEWLGVFTVVLFVAHNFLNIRWYKGLIKGKYNILRILQTVVNFALLSTIISLAYSGMVMSNYVFSFLQIKGGMALARSLHLAASYWCLLLVGIHLGLHWSMVMGIFGRIACGKKAPALKWILRLFAAAIAGYGAYCFFQADIASYMFLKAHFAFLDYEKNGFLVLTEYAAMMGLWVVISYYFAYGLRKLLNKNSAKRIEKGKIDGTFF